MTRLDQSVHSIIVAAMALTEAIDRGEHPTRVADYIRDVERWCRHSHGNLCGWPGEKAAEAKDTIVTRPAR